MLYDFISFYEVYYRINDHSLFSTQFSNDCYTLTLTFLGKFAALKMF